MKLIKQSSTFKNKGNFRFQMEAFSAPKQTIAPVEYDFIKKIRRIHKL
jgi:hypothetical protein